MLTPFLVFLATASMTEARADAGHDPVEASMRIGPSGSIFLAGYAVHRNGDWIVEIYRPSGDGTRLVAVRSLRTPAGREQVRQVDDEACPALRDVASALSDLPSTAIRIPDISPRLSFSPPPAPVADGASYSVWGRGRQPDGAFADVSLRANAGLLADIIQRADESLRPCWA